MDYQQICWNCMNKYVGITMKDGQRFDGFIAHVDNDFVTLAIPTDEMMAGMSGDKRQFGFHPGFFPRRRFFRRRLPFFGISDLFLLPFFL
ncbi:phosphatidylinositol kinase [Paenibacillus lutimineralis]|uniref:Phosphatidylinositol kinase n=1 Tax=Paenibacillus lutimineralis TaxID=2707005 RepID=A0A3Q9I8M8_9BACL|nr:phosphatidylinositol kinase [Paenibacillus lutimineralis]AZS15018.1 phosphatidylinositol kinase [Paenibacillus lutimineralis]